MTIARPLALLPLLALLAGCSKAASPAVPAPLTAPAAPMAVEAAAAAPIPVTTAIITNHTGRVAPTVSAARGPLATDEAPAPEADLEAPPAAAEADALDDPPTISAFLAAEEPPSYNVDDRTPYNVVIPARSAHTATIAWHTEVPTRAIIEYGRAWGFDKNGFTHKVVDDVAKTDHQYTLTELRRFTGYVYKVTAVTALGLKFPEQERKFRTKFWSWR